MLQNTHSDVNNELLIYLCHLTPLAELRATGTMSGYVSFEKHGRVSRQLGDLLGPSLCFTIAPETLIIFSVPNVIPDREYYYKNNRNYD